jgi:diguanylate cyclase (GGDEF)-like protein
VDAATVGSPLCSHFSAPPAHGYCCVPIVADGQALGILHLQLVPPAPGVAAALLDPAELRRLAETVSERLALALANVQLRDALRHQSIRDPLTGVFNRRYMQATLERELSRAARHRHSVGLIFLDLDHFKTFNDTHGHDAGDTLLRELGHLLRARLRVEDVICRYGGEEFVVILPEAALPVAVERAEQLRADVRALVIRHYGQTLGAVTLSAGVAMYPEHAPDGELLVRAADQALYQAKQQGRDRVVVAPRQPSGTQALQPVAD